MVLLAGQRAHGIRFWSPLALGWPDRPITAPVVSYVFLRPHLRKNLSAINDNYLNVQQDILETFVDRGQPRKLAEPQVHAKDTAFSTTAGGPEMAGPS